MTTGRNCNFSLLNTLECLMLPVLCRKINYIWALLQRQGRWFNSPPFDFFPITAIFCEKNICFSHLTSWEGIGILEEKQILLTLSTSSCWWCTSVQLLYLNGKENSSARSEIWQNIVNLYFYYKIKWNFTAACCRYDLSTFISCVYWQKQ